MNDMSLRYFTFGLLAGLVLAFAAEFITSPLQTDPLFVEKALTSCIPYGA